LPKGTLFVVATPIGNLEDITLRALRILREVSIIAAEDTRRTAHLLARHAIATPTTSLHAHNERQKAPGLVERLLEGQSVALVSDAGTPTISDPGVQLIAAAVAAGVRVEPIPGPSAILAALTASGMPVDAFTFLGFPPTKAKDRRQWFERLRLVRGIVVFFEAPHRIERTLTELRSSVGDCPISLSRELTKTHEESVRGPISQILSGGVEQRGEFTVVINIGQLPDFAEPRPPDDRAIGAEFGEMTAKLRKTRRQAVAELARRYGLAPNAVYDAIERSKSRG